MNCAIAQTCGLCGLAARLHSLTKALTENHALTLPNPEMLCSGKMSYGLRRAKGSLANFASVIGGAQQLLGKGHYLRCLLTASRRSPKDAVGRLCPEQSFPKTCTTRNTTRSPLCLQAAAPTPISTPCFAKRLALCPGEPFQSCIALRATSSRLMGSGLRHPPHIFSATKQYW